MTQFIQRIAVLILGVALVSSLVSCGGGGDGDSTDASIQGKGTVGVLLTDMPADPEMFDSIYASITKVELLGSEDNGRVTLYSGKPKTFDLLRLRNEAIPLAFNDSVPAGEYCKIRLILSDLELVMDDDTSATNDNETYHPNLPGNGKLDLLARDCFNVVADEVLTLQLDIDAGESIHVVGNNNGYKFRPVVFVDIVDQSFDSKLVRLTGEIAKIDTDKRSLLLCDAIPSKNMDNLGCVKVHFGDVSAFFDNQQYNGAPRPISELLSIEKLGHEITVVGWPRFWDDPDIDEDKNTEHYPVMQLDALVAELGGFLQVEGVAVSVDSDSSQFSMTVSSGNPIITSDSLAVVFQQTDGDVNGTRIVSKFGKILGPTDIKDLLPVQVQVDGVLLLNEAELQAALVIVDKSALGTEQATGIISSVGVNTLTLDLEEAVSVCGEPSTNQLEVGLAANLDILTVTMTNDGSIISPGGSWDVGQTVGMNGTCEPGGYETDNLVIVDDQSD